MNVSLVVYLTVIASLKCAQVVHMAVNMLKFRRAMLTKCFAFLAPHEDDFLIKKLSRVFGMPVLGAW